MTSFHRIKNKGEGDHVESGELLRFLSAGSTLKSSTVGAGTGAGDCTVHSTDKRSWNQRALAEFFFLFLLLFLLTAASKIN